MEWVRILFFYFMIYSFLGWIIESLFNLSTKGFFLKPNFLILPIKPMYGITAVILIFLKDLLPIWLFLVCAFMIPSCIEYTTAALLSQFFHLKYWDYSHCPYQISGYICLRFSIYWFFLSLILAYAFQPFIQLFYKHISGFWHLLFPLCLLFFMLDFICTIYTKMQLNIRAK